MNPKSKRSQGKSGISVTTIGCGGGPLGGFAIACPMSSPEARQC
jgi:hypothetical protein